MGIVTAYPGWFFLFCILAGAAYSFLLYFHVKKEELAVWQLALMSAFRFFAVTIIAFFLLSPLVRKTSETIEKPILVIAQDNSLSVALAADSQYYRTDYPRRLAAMADRLRSKYEVATWSFDSRVRDSLKTSFSGKQTDISGVFGEVADRYANRNLGAVILATDGIFNKGSNPSSGSRNLNIPVFCIAMGDTLLYRDLAVRSVRYNRKVFLGDKFPVEIWIEATRCGNEKTGLRITKGGKTVWSQTVAFTRMQEFQKISLLLDANEKGMHRYTLILDTLKGEHSVRNNSQDLFIEVNEIREKIAILYQSPHPDVSALKQALESPARYEVEASPLNEFTQSPDRYDLIILVQVPSTSEPANLSAILASNVPLLFVLGASSDIRGFNELKTGLQIVSDKSDFVESVPVLNENFTYFTLDDRIRELINDAPPLLSPFGGYQSSAASEIFAYQKIGAVRSQFPLLIFFQGPGRKTGVLAGENIWKWRLSGYLASQDHSSFDELVGKIVQYLSYRGEKDRFIVRCSQSVPEGEKIEFTAELYNESRELVNTPEVKLVITDESGKVFNYTFSRTDRSYYLDAGALPPGIYKYRADVTFGKTTYTRNSQFMVSPINLEISNTIADHNLLYRLAMDHGGAMVFPRDLDSLEKIMLSRENIKPVAYYRKRFSDLTGNLWLFLVVLALLAAEWFLRKRGGIY